MPVLLEEPPIHVRWAEQAGPMPWVEPGPEPPPVSWDDPDFETSWRLAELEAAKADEAIHWAIPGVTGVTGDPPPPEPTPEVANFTAAVHHLEATDPTLLSPEQALVDLAELISAQQRLRIAQLTRLTDAHVRKLSRLQSQPSLNSWVRRRWDDAPRADIALSGKLRPYVLLRQLVRTRVLGVEAAALVGRALDKVKHHLDRPNGLIDGQPGEEVIAAVVGNIVPLIAQSRLGLSDDDPLLPELIAQAEQISSSPDSQLGKLETAFSLMGRYIPLHLLKHQLAEQVDALLPVQLEQRADQAHRSRNLRLDKNRADGGGRISIDADDELYELAETVLAATVRRDPDNPADTEAKQRDLHGERIEQHDVEADGDVRYPRTRGQRLHDGLKLVLQQYLAAGLAGSHDKAPVAVTVTVSQQNVEGRPGALPARGGSGRGLPRSLLRRWWCDASITALLLTQGLIPLGATHTTRTLTGLERKASRVQHGQTCSGLRCCTPDDPLVTLVPHHIESYAKSGKTSIQHTIWACPRLHDAIHRGKTVPLRNGRWLDQNGWTEKPLIVDY